MFEEQSKSTNVLGLSRRGPMLKARGKRIASCPGGFGERTYCAVDPLSSPWLRASVRGKQDMVNGMVGRPLGARPQALGPRSKGAPA